MHTQEGITQLQRMKSCHLQKNTHGAEEHHAKENIILRKINITYFSHMRKQNLERKRVGYVKGRLLGGEKQGRGKRQW